MFDSSFRQQASAWQRKFQMRQQGGFLQRLLAWLVLGVMLLVGAFFLLFALVLSWILIPVLLYKYRKRMQRFREQAQGSQQHQHGTSGNIIEGEVIRKDEQEPR